MPGTKGFLTLHGGSYQELADQVLAEADRLGATQALGVSLGAGSLLRLLSHHPDRFTHVVLALPAALHEAQPSAVRRAAGLADALRAQDRSAVEQLVRDEVAEEGDWVEPYVTARTSFLLASDLLPLLEALTTDVPVPDPEVLAVVTAEVLVLGAEGDDVHPASVARAVADALPHARLVLFAQPRPLVHDRARLRELVIGHLAGPTGRTGRDRLGDAVSRRQPDY